MLGKLERDGQAKIQKALDRLRRDVMRGISADNVNEMLTRLDDPEIAGRLKDAIERLVSEWALIGANAGRQVIEREVYGVRD